MSVFKGICTALITPFKNGEIDFEAMGRIIDFQIDSGINALLVCGTTGEPATMSEAEKLSLIKFSLDRIAGRVPLIVGAGGNNTAAIISFIKQIQEMDISALLCVTPYYNKATPEGLVRHYRAISESTALPVIVYNVPSRTGVNIQPSTLCRLAEIENIVAIKEASANMAQAVEMMSLCGDKIDMYSGCDEINVPIFSIGGIGAISVLSNIMPAETVKMSDLYFEGDVYSAAKIQKKLMPVIKALFSEVNPIPVKTAASLMGLCRDEMRLPLTPMENKQNLVQVMKEFSLGSFLGSF